MSAVRSQPCSACPYRLDVPSGIWDASEYQKLLGYEGETHEQSFETFMCHATPESYCNGWAVCGTHHTPDSHDLIALRLAGVSPDDVPAESVPLFHSHREAAEHGMADVEDPTPEAVDTAARLMRKYDRLR